MTVQPVRIAITQRVVDIPARGERRDELDQRWSPLLEAQGWSAHAIPNTLQDPVAWIDDLGIALIVLSGGNDLVHLPGASDGAPERDATERTLIGHATAIGLPVLGVCRGMQMLVSYWGSSLRRGEGHRATEHPVAHRRSVDDPVLRSGPVNSFHDWVVPETELASVLRPIATAADGTVEAVIHREHPQVGIMWHPERDPYDPVDMELFAHLLERSPRCAP